MKNIGKMKFLSLCLMGIFTVGLARGTVVYQDDFSGSSGDPLHGTTPDIAPSGTTWTAHANIKADGSLTAAPEGSSAWLPFVPTPGKIYELSATLDAQDANWLSLGFGVGSATTARTLENAVFWSLTQPVGSIFPDETFLGQGALDKVVVATTSADALKVVLTTTNADWVIEWWFDGSLERTETFLAASNTLSISHVYLSSSDSTLGSYDDFLLTVESPRASNPGPANGATTINLSENLSWDKATTNVTKHYLYFAEGNPDLSGVVPVEVTDLVDPITTNPPIVLETGKTYYWRVDESVDGSATNDPGTIVGSPWSFSTIPVGTIAVDDFSAAHNYSDGDVTGTIWDGIRYDEGDIGNVVVNTSDGQLFLKSNRGNWEDTANDGLFLYKNVSGDFVARVEVISGNDINWHDLGLMARVANDADAGAGEDYVMMRYFASGPANSTRSTDDGVSDSGLHTSPLKYLELKREGNLFTVSDSSDGVTYASRGTYTRTDMAGLGVQVGIFQATFSDNVGEAYVDNFIIFVPQVLPSTIVGWSSVSSTVMEMVVDAPSSANNYDPLATADLVAGPWSPVAHSTNGVDGFVVTNLAYSAVDTNGNRVIYVHATNSASFFGIGDTP